MSFFRLALMALASVLATSPIYAQTSVLPSIPMIVPPPSSNAPATPASPAPATETPVASNRPVYWGAISFTPDGSFATAWKKSSKAEAEADVAVRCSKFGRGSCETGAFEGDTCYALVTSVTGRWKLSYASASTTSPAAQERAMNRCKDDRRTRGRCQLRTVVCGDGR